MRNEELGYYRKIVLAQAANPKLREQSHGGAVVTSLLTYGVGKFLTTKKSISRREI